MSETQEQHTNMDWVGSCPACGERFIEENTFEVDKVINQHLFLSCEKATGEQVENAAKWLTASNRRALVSSDVDLSPDILGQKAREKRVYLLNNNFTHIACSKCRELKSREEMAVDHKRRSGIRRVCKRCDQLRVRIYRSNNAEKVRAERRKYVNRPDRRKIHSERRKGTAKEIARRTLYNAIRRGLIVKPNTCEECKTVLVARLIQGHHHDYSKPFEVRWLCSVCHGKAHRLYA